MQLSFSMPFPEPLLAAMPQLSEKLRLGVQSRNPAWYPGFNVCNSTTAIGLQFRCSETVSGPVVAPNNAPTAWSRWKSCVATGFGTVADQMNPFTPSVSNSVQGAVDSASQAALAGAAAHSVERGLTVPLRSGIVRAGVGASEALGEASGWITIANLYYGIAKAYKAEWQQCGW
jgi:hypothetical protein